MQWCMFDANDGVGLRLGQLIDDGRRVAPATSHATLLDLIDAAASGATGGDVTIDEAAAIAAGSVSLAAPIPTPRRNILCVGKNYRDHVAELSTSDLSLDAASVPEAPIVFTKFPNTVVGPGAVVELLPHVTTMVDYEAELAVIIGAGGTDIAAGEAMDHVWGYTIINDVTARDRQQRHRQWLLGKSLNGFCPMGPVAVTADEVDLADTPITCHVNGELRQSANTAELIFGVPELIATISAGFTLQPGDVIATGTPAGVGAGLRPPRFLQPGDEVAITIPSIGTLTNTFK